MEPTIVTRKEMKLIGIEFAGPFTVLSTEVPKVWAAFLQRLGEIPHVVNPDVRYDVSREDQTHGVYQIYTTVEVEQFDQIPYGMVGFTLPERKYAKITHQGPMDQVQGTYIRLFTWLQEHGYQRAADVHSVERYDERYTPTVHPREREANAYEIYIPIQ